jgi:hypothetical protein
MSNDFTLLLVMYKYCEQRHFLFQFYLVFFSHLNIYECTHDLQIGIVRVLLLNN